MLSVTVASPSQLTGSACRRTQLTRQAPLAAHGSSPTTLLRSINLVDCPSSRSGCHRRGELGPRSAYSVVNRVGQLDGVRSGARDVGGVDPHAIDGARTETKMRSSMTASARIESV